ncbi:MAG: leucine-rich repeat domain-containing protein [Candidatus Sigynarchaeota archaeon]
MDLSDAGIEALSEIQGLDSCVDIYVLLLARNHVKSLREFASYAPLRNLEYLDLSYNDVQVINKEDLVGFDQLKYLLLSNNKLTRFPSLPPEILPQLQHIDLRFNKITHVPILANMLKHDARFVNLASNPIVEVNREEADFILSFGPQEDPVYLRSREWSDDKLMEYIYWKKMNDEYRCAEIFAQGDDDIIKKYLDENVYNVRKCNISTENLSIDAMTRLRIYGYEGGDDRWERLTKRVMIEFFHHDPKEYE